MADSDFQHLSVSRDSRKRSFSDMIADDPWYDFEDGLKEIYRGCRLSQNRYLQLYKFAGTNSTSESRSGGKVDISFRGHELYCTIKRHLEDHVRQFEQDIAKLDDDEVLEFYCQQWDKYLRATAELTKICVMLNNHWFRFKGETSKTPIDIHNTDQLALSVWSYVITKSPNSRVVNAVLNVIDKERCGEDINRTNVEKVIETFVKLQQKFEEKLIVIHKPKSHPDTTVYKNVFENVFLEQTRDIYTRESDEIFKNFSVKDYLQIVEARLSEEKVRAVNYLDQFTLESVQKICDEILIERRHEVLFLEFQKMIVEKDYTYVDPLCKFVTRFPTIIENFHEFFEGYIHDHGIAAIEKIEKEVSNDPKLYIDTILRVYHQFLTLISTEFENNVGLLQCLDKACRKFANYNAVTRPQESTSANTPELIAKYCDFLLKKRSNNLSADELENTLSQVIIVFRFLDDKDIFQKFYCKMLAKRLLYQQSNSYDAEESMISKMKLACGFEYTTKFQKMFRDISINQDLNDKLRNDKINFCGTDFNVQVLTFGSWPFQLSCDVELPEELAKTVHSFTTFYNSQYSGRKLNWISQLSKGELTANCFKNKYILQLSTFQIAVLLQFNTGDKFSLQQLEDATKIKFELLMQVVHFLLKSKLLVCGDDNDDIDNLQPTSIVRLFLEYKNKKQRINLNVPLKFEAKTEREATRKFVEVERKALIQAAIVRVMKVKKELQHQQLLAEVFAEISALFKPKVVDIKKCIDVLIEREYLERVGGAKDVYQYLA